MSIGNVLSQLRQEQQQAEKHLNNIRQAISALSNGGLVSSGSVRNQRRPEAPGGKKKRRKMSAKARKAISDAQKKRWAAQKAGAKK
jgi:hypothetical protein